MISLFNRRGTAVAMVVTGGATALLLGHPALAGGDKIAFPEKLGVLYATVERPDVKQFRELYTSQPAIDAARKGEPMPDGTVITMVQYAALLTAGGEPQKDRDGRFIKGTRVGYAVMEKRTGWGAEYVPQYRNGEWEYQAFTADRKANDKANLFACFSCHKPLDKQDFVFSYDRMKAAK
jgi:hypothetical protein